jgi:hypothetical protein
METGKTGKYFKYAIGEIVLVVIGILIALGINNWNEHRKQKLEEKIILAQLHIEFNSNLKQLNQKIELKKEIINSALKLFKYIDFEELRNKDSIDYYLARTIPYTTFDPIVNEIALSNQLNLLQNDSLKQKLTYWTSELADNREDELTWKYYRENKYVPFLVEHYQLRTIRNLANQSNLLEKYLIEENTSNIVAKIGNSKYKENYNALLNLPNFEDHLERCVTQNRHSLNQSLILRKKIMQIIGILDHEIKH